MTAALWISLFVSSFLAATLVPFYSEIAVATAIAADASPVMVVIVASTGNTAGAVVNWFLGLGLERFRHRRWFPVPERELERAQSWFRRYGVWTLLLTWMPVGGDALTVIAGVMRVPFPVFLLLTAVGKTARYIVLVLILENVI